MMIMMYRIRAFSPFFSLLFNCIKHLKLTVMLKDLIEAIHDFYVLEYGEGLDEEERELYESLSQEELELELRRVKLKFLTV